MVVGECTSNSVICRQTVDYTSIFDPSNKKLIIYRKSDSGKSWETFLKEDLTESNFDAVVKITPDGNVLVRGNDVQTTRINVNVEELLSRIMSQHKRIQQLDKENARLVKASSANPVNIDFVIKKTPVAVAVKPQPGMSTLNPGVKKRRAPTKRGITFGEDDEGEDNNNISQSAVTLQ